MAASRSSSTRSAGRSLPTSIPSAARKGALDSLAYTRRPARVIRSTGFGFWPGTRLSDSIAWSRASCSVSRVRACPRPAAMLDTVDTMYGTA